MSGYHFPFFNQSSQSPIGYVGRKGQNTDFQKWADPFFFLRTPIKKKALFIAPTISPFSALKKKHTHFCPMGAFFCTFFELMGDILEIFVMPIVGPSGAHFFIFFIARPFFFIKKKGWFFDCQFARIFFAPFFLYSLVPKG